MRAREAAYAGLALLGLLGTWYFNIQYVAQGGGFNPAAWLRLGFVNPAAASITVDLLVAFATFLVWTVLEARRLGMPVAWLYPVIGFLVAFAFAFPLFLLMRERHIRVQHGLRSLQSGSGVERDRSAG